METIVDRKKVKKSAKQNNEDISCRSCKTIEKEVDEERSWSRM